MNYRRQVRSEISKLAVFMKKSRSTCLCIVGLLFWELAFAEPCSQSTTVTTVGFSAYGAEADTGVRQALAQALTAAVAQVNGIFIQQESSLESIFIAHMLDAERTDEIIDTFRETIQQQTTGYVSTFEVLEETLNQGIVSLRVRVTVCTDQRLALSITAPDGLANMAMTSLLPIIRESGWRVVRLPPTRIRDNLRTAYDTGATILLQINIRPVAQNEYRDTVQVTLEFSGQITDLRTSIMTNSYTISTIGVGINSDQAMQDAVTKGIGNLGAQFASDQGTTQRGSTQIEFLGVTRLNTVHEIERLISTTASIKRPESPIWNQDTQTVSVTAVLYDHPCNIAAVFERARRILIHTLSCNQDRIRLSIARE
ncbi:MAG: hypothetical protein QXE80_09610 [Pyrobaculum sp.]